MATVTPEVTIRGYRREDDVSLLELFRVAFDGWPKVPTTVTALDHLRWKNESHPRSVEASVVAEADGQLVGASMQWVYPILVKDEARLATSGMDTCVHPDFRGRDVYTRLRQAHATFDPWVDVRIGTTANQFVKRKRESLGYRFFGNALELLTWEGGRLRRGRAAAGFALARLEGRGQRVELAGAPGTDGSFAEGFDGFTAEASRPFTLIAERTFARMCWRHFDPRGGPAELRVIRDDGGAIAAYTVLRARARRGYIADLLAMPGRDDMVAAALRDAVQRLGGIGFTKVAAWLPRVHAYRRVFLAQGFRPSGRIMDLRYQPVAMAADTLAFLDAPDAAFHFMAGDTDLV